MDKIELEIIPSDFKGTNYMNACDCVISKAIKRRFPDVKAYEGYKDVYITKGSGVLVYDHHPYSHIDFREDRNRAENAKENEVLRVIELRLNTEAGKKFKTFSLL